MVGKELEVARYGVDDREYLDGANRGTGLRGGSGRRERRARWRTCAWSYDFEASRDRNADSGRFRATWPPCSPRPHGGTRRPRLRAASHGIEGTSGSSTCENRRVPSRWATSRGAASGRGCPPPTWSTHRHRWCRVFRTRGFDCRTRWSGSSRRSRDNHRIRPAPGTRPRFAGRLSTNRLLRGTRCELDRDH